jgi:hypothetical protein
VNILVRELGRTASKGLLKVRKVLSPDFGDCPMASVCCFGYFVMWVASLKERDDVLCFIRGERLHDAGGEEEADVLVCLYLVQVYYRSHDLHVQFQPSGTKFCVTI